MDIAAVAVPLLAAGLLGAALRAPLPHAALPLLFGLMVASVSLGYVAATRGESLPNAVAIAGALLATIALAAGVCAHDARLAAAAGTGDALLLAGLPQSPHARWRKFEHDLWAYIAAHAPHHPPSSDDD